MPEFKLVATEPLGPTSLKHVYLIDATYSKYESPIFNIHNFAEICFVYERINSNLNIEFKTKEHMLSKGLKNILHVKCLDNSWKLLCTEDWSDLKPLGWRSIFKYLEVTYYITVNKKDSIVTKLYEDQDFTDFYLSTTGGTVPVHRAILAANSEVFKTMLSHEWKETAEGRVHIEGVTLETLQHLKQYMYLGTLPDDGLRQLLQLAMYYLMTNLKSKCLMRLAHSVTAENLHEILEYSFLNKIPELTFAVLEMMPTHMVDEARQIMIKKIQGEKNEKVNEE